MVNPIYLKDIYVNMAASSVPDHDGDVDQSIFLSARNIFDTERLHLLISKHEGTAYFFAVPSRYLMATPSFETPLAAAFPAHPQHKGDGIYFYARDNFAAAVIKEKTTLRCIVNNTDNMRALVEDMDLPVYPVDTDTPWVLETVSGKYRRRAERLSLKLFKASAWITAIAGVLAFGAGATASVLSAKVNDYTVERTASLNNLMKKIETTSPLGQQLAQVQKLSATVVRAGGWIDHYEYKNNKETFSLSLPEWVTQDYIVALGSGAVAEHDRNNNVIKVEKK